MLISLRGLESFDGVVPLVTSKSGPVPELNER